jgi:hypothetical protein
MGGGGWAFWPVLKGLQYIMGSVTEACRPWVLDMMIVQWSRSTRPWQEVTLRCGLILPYHSTADRDSNWRGRDGNTLGWQKGKSYTLLFHFVHADKITLSIHEHLLVNHIRWMHPVFILLTEKSLLLSSCNISWFEHTVNLLLKKQLKLFCIPLVNEHDLHGCNLKQQKADGLIAGWNDKYKNYFIELLM